MFEDEPKMNVWRYIQCRVCGLFGWVKEAGENAQFSHNCPGRESN